MEGLLEKAALADVGLKSIRKDGFVKGHLSKDGKPEAVYFTRLPFLKEGNPNTEESIAKLEKYGVKVRENFDSAVFLGVGASYVGNKVLFDVKTREFWNEGIEVCGKDLLLDNRVNYLERANYLENSELEKLVKEIILNIRVKDLLKKRQAKQLKSL